MTIEDMDSNNAARQYKRLLYQQRYFSKERQLDNILNQKNQLLIAIAEAESKGNQPLVMKLKNALKGLVEKWNSVRNKVD